MSSQLSKTELYALISQLRSVRNAIPEDSEIRQELYDAACDVVSVTETPAASMQRIAYSVNWDQKTLAKCPVVR